MPEESSGSEEKRGPVESDFVEVTEAPPKPSPGAKRKGKGSGSVKKKPTWDTTFHQRLNALDKSTKALAKKVDGFVDILESKIDTSKSESLNEVGEVTDTLEMAVAELKADQERKILRLEEKLASDFGEVLEELEEKIFNVEGNLEDIERRLFEGANEMAVVMGRVNSKDIGTRVKFLDDQIAKTANLVHELQELLSDIKQKSPVGLEKRIAALEARAGSTHPTDLPGLRMRVEGLERALGNKEALRKIKALNERLDELEARAR